MGCMLIWGMELVPGIKVSSGQLHPGCMAPLPSGGLKYSRQYFIKFFFPLTLAIYLKLILSRTSGYFALAWD